MVDGKVYILKSNNSKTCYIGSCKNYISTRAAQHKYSFNLWLEGNHKAHRYSSFLVFIDDLSPNTELLEEVEGNKEYVRERENFFIKEYRKNGWDVVNVNCPVYDKEKCRATSQRYYQKHIIEKKKYYQLNRDTILAKAKSKYVPRPKKKPKLNL